MEGQDKPVEVRSVSALGAHGAHGGVPTVEGGPEGPSSYNFQDAPLLSSNPNVVMKAGARSNIYTASRIHFHFRPLHSGLFINPSVHSTRSAA